MSDVLTNYSIGGNSNLLPIPENQDDLKVNMGYITTYELASKIPPSWLPATDISGAQSVTYLLKREGNILDASVKDTCLITTRTLTTTKEEIHVRVMNQNNNAFSQWLFVTVDLEQLTSTFLTRGEPINTNQHIQLDNGSADSPNIRYVNPGEALNLDWYNKTYRAFTDTNKSLFVSDDGSFRVPRIASFDRKLQSNFSFQKNLYIGTNQWISLILVPATNRPWVVEGYLSLPDVHFLAKFTFAGSVNNESPTLDLDILSVYRSYVTLLPQTFRIRCESTNNRVSLDIRFAAAVNSSTPVRMDITNILLYEGTGPTFPYAVCETWPTANSVGLQIINSSSGQLFRKVSFSAALTNAATMAMNGVWGTTGLTSYGNGLT